MEKTPLGGLLKRSGKCKCLTVRAADAGTTHETRDERRVCFWRKESEVDSANASGTQALKEKKAFC